MIVFLNNRDHEFKTEFSTISRLLIAGIFEKQVKLSDCCHLMFDFWQCSNISRFLSTSRIESASGFDLFVFNVILHHLFMNVLSYNMKQTTDLTIADDEFIACDGKLSFLLHSIILR
jgi:hypothetical protein